MRIELRRIVLAALTAGTALGASAEATEGRHTLVLDGRTRSYVVRAPALDHEGPRVPLVLVLHGGGGNAASAEHMTGFTQKAREHGFVVVYPEGTGGVRGRLLTWNAGHCCGPAMRQNADDVGFVNALIDELSRTHPIDPDRIYVTGMSNGGMMAHRLGIELSHRIAAIAPVVATLFGDEKKPANPVSALMLNGMLDRNVPAVGGSPGGRGRDAWDGTPARPALEQAEFWANAGGCAKEPRRNEAGATLRWVYTCPAKRAVELVLVKDNGHAWPGGERGSRRGNEPSTSLNATDLIWDFFSAHPKNP